MRPTLAPFLVGILSSSAMAQGLKLNPPLARGDLDVESGRLVLSADRTRAAYVQGERLFAVETDGSSDAVRLDEGAPIQNILELALTPDGGSLVFRSSTLPAGTRELFQVPMDGSEPPRRLSHALPAGGHVEWGYLNFGAPFALTPDGAHVIYLAYSSAGGVVELFSVPSDGSSAPRRMHQPLTGGFDVVDFRVGAGGRVAFHLLNPGVFDGLLTAPEDAHVDAVRVDAAVAGAQIVRHSFSTSGARVLFTVNLPGEAGRLFSVPADGSQAPVRLDNLPLGLSYVSASEAAAGERVVYSTYKPSFGEGELYSVPADGSAAPLALGAPLFGQWSRFELADGGNLVLFSNQLGLHRVPVDGASAPLRLSAPEGELLGFELAPDGSRVVFSVYLSPAGDGLYSVQADGSAPSVRLNAAAPSGPGLRFAVGADSTRVVYLQQVDQGGLLQALFSVPIDGSSAPVKLDACVAPTRSVGEFQLAGDAAVYIADERSDEHFEPFRAPVDASAPSQQLGLPRFGARVGDVVAYALSHDGTHAAYLADVQLDGRYELATAALRGPGPSVPLHPPLPDLGEVLDDFAFGPDDDWIVFRLRLGVTGDEDLFATPVGGGPARQLNLGGTSGDVSAFWLPGPQALPQFRQRVVFTAWPEGGEGGGLWSAECAGTLPVLLAAAGVTHLEFDPNGARLVYIGSEGAGNFLWSVPSDGSLPPNRVDFQATPANRVRAFRVTSDGSKVVYAADAEYAGVNELYLATIQGALVRKLSQVPYPSPGVADFELAPGQGSGVRVVYRAYPASGQGPVLYSVALAGGTPQRLDAVPLPSGSVTDFRIHPSGQKVVFRADTVLDEVFELWWVPIDGSAEPVRLHAALSGARDVESDFVATEGCALFRAELVQNGKLELFHALFDGSPAQRVSAPLVGNAKVRGFVPGATPGRVFYLADTAPDGGQELFDAVLSGERPVRRRSGALVPRGSVVDARPSSDGAHVVYLADEDEDNVFELYRSDVARPPQVRRR